MVTLNGYRTYGANRNVLDIVGLSTDEKPTNSIEDMPVTNGSTYFCIDTSDCYMFDEENAKWYSM